MSLLDFPRINFSGNLDINVPTINNAYYFPLTLYDAVRSVPFLPPRLYFSNKEKVDAVVSNLNPVVHNDVYNNENYVYIEILTVNTIEILRNWCMTPIYSDPAKNKFDAEYLPYYNAAVKDLGALTGISMLDNAPGYWNMFGDMGMYISKTKVVGVQSLSDNYEINTWTENSQNIPADVQPILGAYFDTDAQPGAGNATSLLVETISNQSVYASVFCSQVNLFQKGQENTPLISGEPYRFCASVYNAWRVLDWMPPMAGSARFSSSIPLSQISDAESSAVLSYFKANSKDPREIKGITVSFTVKHVFENRFDQDHYLKNGTATNAAQSSTVGTISPWYEGDLKAGQLGRNLIALNMDHIYNNSFANNAPLYLAPSISQLKVINSSCAIFSIDLGNTLPETIIPPYVPDNPPVKRGEATFDTFTLGELYFTHSSDLNDAFMTINVNPHDNPMIKVEQQGGIFDVTIEDSRVISAIQNNDIQVYLKTDTDVLHVLTESDYMITSDQRCLYADQGDRPVDGYRSFSSVKEPCVLRILKRGVPIESPIPIGIAHYDAPEAGNDPQGTFQGSIKWDLMNDNEVVQLDQGGLVLNDNAMYYFIYKGQYPNDIPPAFAVKNNYTIMDTGSFVCMRIHQDLDLEKYINPANWDTTPPTYEVVYENVFKLYDVVYPVMALIHPFNKEQWNNPTMAGRVVQRVNSKYWNNIMYMPRSRELSKSQLALLNAWAQYLNTVS